MAIVTESTVGMAMGMPPIRSTIEEVVNAIGVPAVLDRVHDNDLDEDADGDRVDTKVTKGLQHLLEVADLVGAID